jgi:hypothetical protein
MSRSPVPSFYRYDAESDVHVVDCGGVVTLETGKARLETLASELATHKRADGAARLLIDFRETIWEDENVHLELSRITRAEFGLNPDNTGLRAAIVNTRWSGAVSDNEHWFLSEGDAMSWLCAQDF